LRKISPILFLLRYAYQKASGLKYDSQLHTQIILDSQRNRLERFLSSVNLLFVLTVIIACCLVFLLFHQTLIRNREVAAKNQLREQHDLLASLLQNLPEGIAVWDQNRSIVHLNKSFIEITGYSREDMPDSGKWAQLAYPDPLYRQSVQKDWKKALKRDSVSEYKVTCKDGKVKDIVIRAAFLPGSGIINTLTDVTKRNEDEKALQENREIKARSKKMESLGLLAGGVAHDLNNILSGIVSYPELLLLDLAEDHKLRRPIEIIRDSGRKATAIVMDLLTVARGVAISKEPLNVNSIIQDYLKSPDFELVQTYHPDVKVEMSLAENSYNITGSKVHIRKILMNLVSNGCEAIKSTGRVGISTVNCYIDTPIRGYDHVEEGKYVLLSVADQGEGISEDSIERIFEPFYSKKIMGRSGTGLGLAVVWNVVQDHHGYITVKSGEKGTTFSVYLPATGEDVSEQVSLLEISSFSGAGESILVVDDISSQRQINSSILKKLRYRPESVASGEEAVEFVKNHPVDLILLDMIMDPGINGRETYEKILQINPKQKAIIISGFAETQDVKDTLQMGAGCYLKKPIEIQELGVAVRDVLNIT